MKQRKTQFERKSKETEIKIKLNIDGQGKTSIKTPIGILDHMLELFAFHGFFDLDLKVKGDTHIDIHHTNEDIGIALGKAFAEALGDNRRGIKRFGSAFAPMEKTIGRAVIDLSGRGYFTLELGKGEVFYAPKEQEGYSIKYLEHFLESFAHGLGATVHVKIENVDADLHTNLETVFKSLGLALDQATQVDPRRKGAVPSTKGIID